MKYLEMRVLVPVDKVVTSGKIVKINESYRWGETYIVDQSFNVDDIEIEVDGFPEGVEIVSFDKDEAEELHLSRYGEDA